MTLDHWITILFGAMALISGFFYWLDTKRSSELTAIRDSIREAVTRSASEHTVLRNQMVAEHTAITTTVQDMARSVGDEYVHRREFDVWTRNLDAGVIDARSEIGAIGVQVGKIHERIDRLIDRRPTGFSDG